MRMKSVHLVVMGLLFAGMKVPSVTSNAPAQSANMTSSTLSVSSGSTPAYAGSYPTEASSDLGRQIMTLLAEPTAARAHWGIAVTAMDGTPIYGLNEGKLFRPASNAKLFTTAAAMTLLGPESVTRTEVIADSLGSDGVVRGDVWLRSTGDANLSGLAFPYTPVAGETPASSDPLKAIDDLAAQVAARGVKRITGKVIGDDTQWIWEPYPTAWAIDDMPWGYGAPVSSLTVNDSEITLTVHPGLRAGDAATVTQSPDAGFYTLNVHVNTTAAKSANRINVERPVGSKLVSVTGEIAVDGKDTETLAVSDPPLFAAEALKARLIAHGVAVEGEASASERPSTALDGFTKQSRTPVDLPKPGEPLKVATEVCNDGCGEVLASRVSPALLQDVTYTLKESQNLHAEMLLRRLGRNYGTEASSAQGARVVRQFLLNAGLSGDDFLFYDGSGLSDHDLVAPRVTAQLLLWASKQPWFVQWKAALPLGGVDGTLAGRFKEPELKGRVWAKTGTLGESRGLAGYVQTASGRWVIVAIYVDNHATFGSMDRAVMDKIVAAVVKAE
jgi:D-alanyl-D-alanine carboxypeptidase/D-alanyl-D-alanine-endopeptidase (penicillin-binding protein 4)